jgi:hypothetical protein
MTNFRSNVIFLLSLLAASSANAFSKDHCGHLFPTSDGDHPPYYSPIYISTMVPSTTSYFSSIGPCSMYGEGGVRAAFLKNELPSIQVDAARGKGEYLNAFAELSGCPSGQYSQVGFVMQKQFKMIFENSPDDTVLLHRIDSVLRAEPSLQKSCLALKQG